MIHKTLMTFAAATLATAAFAETDVPFALDWKFEGPSAPYFHALDSGYFSDAGLNVVRRSSDQFPFVLLRLA